MAKIEEFLMQSIGTGEILNLVYSGGSTPGKPRDIIPIKIEGDALIARQSNTNGQKTFKLDKIMSVSNGTETVFNEVQPSVEPTPLSLPELETLEEYALFIKDELEAKGWTFDYSDTHISITGRFKNGKLKRSPSLSLRYEKMGTNLYYTPEFDIVEEKYEKEKPWSTNGKQFKYMNKAVVEFFKASKSLEP